MPAAQQSLVEVLAQITARPGLFLHIRNVRSSVSAEMATVRT